MAAARAFSAAVLAATFAGAAMVSAARSANAAELPPVKATTSNKVPTCATPGRLMAFLTSRNGKLDARFDGIATDYMRHGEELSIRWDIAFFQMLLETGNLTFTGDVKPRQNNFAGLGATGRGEPGESFKDVSTGVRAHLEHLLMYTGEKVANPVAERTRKVQEWGVLTEWQKSIKGPITFAQLGKKWAPSTRKYASDIEAVAESFMNGPCKGADPRPELVASARRSLLDEATKGSAPKPADVATKSPAPTPGEDAMKRAVAAAKTDGNGRSTLGAADVDAVKPVVAAELPTTTEVAGPKTATVLNAGKSEAVVAEKPLPAPSAAAVPASPTAPSKVAAAGSAAVAGKPGKAPAAKDAAGRDPKEPAKCNVFTASYGGQKAVIIKAVTGDAVNYTVLDVNEGAETRETEAYIAAYAKGGKLVGDFKTPAQALDKAFDLCPEG